MFSRKLNFISGNGSLNVPSRDFPKPFLSPLIVILLLSTLLSVVAYANPKQTQPFRVKGSFVIAAICKDGIIVASDSRGTLKDRQGRRIAYYDINQKIFPVGDKMIADTGYASLNDAKVSFLSALMSRFSHSFLSSVDVDQLPNSYFKYASTVLPAAGAESAKLQTLVFAGYERTRPTLCIYEGESSRAIKCRNSGYLSSPHQQVFELANVGSLSFQEAAQIMRQTIDDYAAAVQPGSVGGPVVIRTITASGSKWFGTPPNWPDWEAFTDLAKDYKNNRVPFHLMPGVNKEQLDKLIDDGAVWARLGQTSSARGSATDVPVIGSYPPDR
jgi:20S proteasome alpha/beta subunit